MASFTGGSRATTRIQALEQSRRRQQDDVNRRRAHIAATSESALRSAAASSNDTTAQAAPASTPAAAAAAAAGSGAGADGRFAARADTVEDLLKSDTVGLVSHRAFKARREYLERCAAGELERRDARLREQESETRRARLPKANRAKLSFAADGSDDDDDDDDNDGDDDDDDDDSNGGGNVGGGKKQRIERRSEGESDANASKARQGPEERKEKRGCATNDEGGGGGADATANAGDVAAAKRKRDDAAAGYEGAGADKADGDGDVDGGDADVQPGTAGDEAAVVGAGVGVGVVAALKRRRRRLGMDPGVETQFLPDREREVAESAERSRLRQEWTNEQERVKREAVRVTYSYWDGRGHRRTMQCRKGTTIGRFLAVVQGEFRELRNTSADALMFVKEDVIIPHHYSFYDLVATRARGKSGPLFNFDVVEDVRLVADASKEKEDAHAAKVVERRWYERNRHIFPASRWEVYDPTKTYARYTIHGD